MHRMKGCRIARFQHRRRESMRSSMKTPLTGQHLGMSLNNGLPIYYLRWPELLESNFEAASPSLFTVTCTTTRDRTRLSSGVYTTYRQHVRHKQLLDTLRGKVLYFIWSPGLSLRYFRPQSSASRIASLCQTDMHLAGRKKTENDLYSRYVVSSQPDIILNHTYISYQTSFK